jgi:4-amino-4-deoxy-L-arabinose transferase-like glycosyltransferase
MRMSLNQRWNSLSFRRREYVVLALLVLLAALLRFYQLDAIPVGLDVDEAEEGWEARRVADGEAFPIFFTASYGGEPMHYYAIAFFLRLFGVKALSVRLASAVEGLLLVPVIYLLARELLVPTKGSRSLVPLLSAFWVATSYWHITYSRTGMEPVLLPLVLSVGTFFLWRGIRLQEPRPFILAGFFVGASLYTYRPVRFFPLLLLTFLGYHLLADAKFRRTHLANLILLTVVFTLVILPLGLYAVSNPEMFFRRELAVTVVGRDWVDRSLPLSIVEGTIRTFGMYNLVPDPQFERNPGQRPILDPVSSLFFLIGLASAWLRRREPAYAFVFLWLMVLSLPGALSPDVSPQYSRGMGALPAVAMLFSLGSDRSREWLRQRRVLTAKRSLHWIILGLALFSVPLFSCRDYFAPWLQRQREGIIMGARDIEAAAVMNTTHVLGGVWILPASSVDAAGLPFFQTYFLYEGELPYHTLHVDETSATRDLSTICQGRSTALVVDWTDFVMERAYESENSDPKGLIDFLLRKYGQRLEVEPHESFDLVTYTLPRSPQFSIADSFEGVGLDFGEDLRLAGMACGGSSVRATSSPEEVERKVLPSGKEGWVVLRWEAVRDLDRNYKVGVYLLDSRGRVVGQVDKLLLSNNLEPTSRWLAQQLEIDYYTLPCVAATPPGAYSVEVAVYDAETMERLQVVNPQSDSFKTSLTVGTLEVIEPLTPPDIDPMEPTAPADRDVAPGLELLGHDLPVTVASPGERVRLALYWRAVEDVQHDYILSVRLADEDGDVWFEEKGRPADGTYPTTEWDEGEVLRDWHDLLVPPNAPQGCHDLLLQVLEDGQVLGELQLGHLDVQGRSRDFTAPAIEFPTEARAGEEVLFLGYDLDVDRLSPGQSLEFTLYWQALDEIQVSYTVFTHLLDAEERVWGQKDSIPLGGEAPTTSWLPGEVITDQYEIVVDPEAPAGAYVIEIGMYDAGSGQRLSVYDVHGEHQGDRVLLQATPVLVAE